MRILQRRHSCWRLSAGVLCLCAWMIVGCGGARPLGTVTGTVTYKGAPVPAAKVLFYGAGDQVANAVTDEDGSYVADKVPLGLVKVAVVSSPAGPGLQQAAKNSPGKRRFGKGNLFPEAVNVVSVPKKYGDPAQSGFSLTVTEGSQAFSIDLK
jgi:hypothetical protein